VLVHEAVNLEDCITVLSQYTMSLLLTYFEQTTHLHCGLAFLSFGIVALMKYCYKLQYCIIRGISAEQFLWILFFWDMMMSLTILRQHDVPPSGIRMSNKNARNRWK
jgi:hypothetical protein